MLYCNEFRQAVNHMWVFSTLQAHLTITSQMVLQKSVSYMSKACYSRPKSQVKTHTLPQCCIETTFLVMTCYALWNCCGTNKPKSDFTMSYTTRMQVKEAAVKQSVKRPQSKNIRPKKKKQEPNTGY